MKRFVCCLLIGIYLVSIGVRGEGECVGETCPVADIAEADTPGRGLQSTHRVVTMPVPPHFHDVLESVVNYLVVHEAYFAWSKEWFPKPLADAWFEFAGNRMFERFEEYVITIVKHFEDFFQRTVNQSFAQKHCQLEVKGDKHVHVDDHLGLKLKAYLHEMEGLCDFKYDYFGHADLQVGRTAFTQFTIDFSTPYNDMVTEFKAPVKFEAAHFRGRPLHIKGEVRGNLHMEGAPSGFEVTLNGPKLKPWGPDHQSVVNSCVESARYHELQLKVDYCYANVYVDLDHGHKFSCPFTGHHCPLNADPGVCASVCASINNSLCYQIEHSVIGEAKYLSQFLSFSTNAMLPYCESGTRTDSVA